MHLYTKNIVLRREDKYILLPQEIMKFVQCQVFIGCELKAASFGVLFVWPEMSTFGLQSKCH